MKKTNIRTPDARRAAAPDRALDTVPHWSSAPVIGPVVRAGIAPDTWASSPVPSGGGGLDDQVFSRLLRDRIVFLGSEVTDAVANALCAQLLLLNAEDPERDIWLYINSPGGSVTAGMGIYDTMQWVSNDVCTVALGFAASMGQFLLCSGAPGKRYALPHSRVVMHQPHGGFGGTETEIRIQAEQMLHTKKTMAELIAFHTGQSLETVERDSDRDRWFTADEAREYGFVDQVVRTLDTVTA
ncbi:ATP-dependent Clp protease proteolytic subunit [Cryptosporangium minutisporangium]|uniref:ATP-dependent Clp protease proteolytic subunit n=1 Tax=Cryptosporangium minutisporangium TaxID=113569 RepID=A0ABP6T6I7_9ACTN